jgi:hypothetical protein
LDDSYVTDMAEPLSHEDLETMLSNWIKIEDEQEMIEFEAQEELAW